MPRELRPSPSLSLPLSSLFALYALRASLSDLRVFVTSRVHPFLLCPASSPPLGPASVSLRSPPSPISGGPLCLPLSPSLGSPWPHVSMCTSQPHLKEGTPHQLWPSLAREVPASPGGRAPPDRFRPPSHSVTPPAALSLPHPGPLGGPCLLLPWMSFPSFTSSALSLHLPSPQARSLERKDQQHLKRVYF